MELNDFYYTVKEPVQTEFKERGSKFIAYAYPVNSPEEFKKYLTALKEEHPKATHHCFAYRIGTDGNKFRSSDDGEPSGSAGKPILGQIDSKQLTNVLVVVVRYFGGTLLGVPGLISAYRSAAALVLQLTPIVRKSIDVTYQLQFDYTKLDEVMRILKRNESAILERSLQLFCTCLITVPRNREEFFLQESRSVENLELKKVLS